MKRTLILSSLLIASLLSKAQTGYISTFNNGPNMTTDRYVIGSGPTIPLCSPVEQIRDSSWVRWRFKAIITDALINTTGSQNYLYTDNTGTWYQGAPTWYTKTQSDGRYLQSFTETDPIWTAASTNYFTKTQSDARYLQSFTETDPVWTAASTNYFTKTQSDARYLQSFTELDPLFNTKFSTKTTDNLAEGTSNLYFTQARARASLVSGTGINYNSTTGVITNTAVAVPDSVVYYNSSGKINQKIKIWCGTVTPTVANGQTVDISSAGFSTILSVKAIPVLSTSTPTSVPNIAINSISTTSVALNITQGNNSLVTILGLSVLGGPATIFTTSFTGMSVYVEVTGY